MTRGRSGAVLNITPPVFRNLGLESQNRNPWNHHALSRVGRAWNLYSQGRGFGPSDRTPRMRRGSTRRSSHTERPSLTHRVESPEQTARRGAVTGLTPSTGLSLDQKDSWYVSTGAFFIAMGRDASQHWTLGGRATRRWHDRWLTNWAVMFSRLYFKFFRLAPDWTNALPP